MTNSFSCLRKSCMIFLGNDEYTGRGSPVRDGNPA